MDRLDRQSECVRVLAAQGRKPKKGGNGVHRFNCIRTGHNDKGGDAWVGEARHGCYACAFEESIDTLCEALGIALPKWNGGALTIEQLCEVKGFSLDVAARHGWRTTTGKYGHDVVAIPYRDAEGKTLREKHRIRAKPGKPSTFWGPGVGSYLLGLHVLAKVKPADEVILCEGETDALACWHRGILALGVPGATNWKPEWAPLLAGRQVYVWQEPGEAGAKFAQSLSADFPDAKILRSEKHKDLADLFKSDPKGFAAAVKALKAEALPLGAVPPAVKYVPLIGATLEAIEARNQDPIDATPTPIPGWNRACRDDGGGVGLARGWNVTVAGNTGHGKSLLALNVGATAIRHGERVAFHSVEMSVKQLVTRTLAICSGISVSRLERGDWYSPEDYKTARIRMAEIHERTGGLFYVNEAPIYKLEDIEAAVRYQTEYMGCRFHIVDYLQLCHVTGAKNVVEAVPVVSGRMRVLSKELNVTMVGLSQFNRETSKEREQRPHVQGLMGGSALENDSDQVVLLNHANSEKSGHYTDTELLLAKNRHGPCEDIPVQWDWRTLTLTEKGGVERGDAWEGEERAA